MGSLKRAINYQRINFFKALGIFWAIMLVLNTASYISMYMLGKNFVGLRVSDLESVDGVGTWVLSVAASNIMPIVIFLIVYCYKMYYEYFPVAVSFSVTRKDFYLSTVIDNVAAAFTFAVIQSILMKMDCFIIGRLGQTPKIDFSIFNSSTDSILFIIFSLFVCFMIFISMINMLAVLNYKLGYKLWLIFGALIFAGLFPESFFEKLFATRISSLAMFIAISIFLLFLYYVTYLIVKTTNVKNKLV